jgi:ABC-type branched-subunit amino acid transport system substrate-binding protein
MVGTRSRAIRPRTSKEDSKTGKVETNGKEPKLRKRKSAMPESAKERSRHVAPDARERVPTSSLSISLEARATFARIAAQFLNIVLFAVASRAQDAQNPPGRPRDVGEASSLCPPERSEARHFAYADATRGKQIYLYGTAYNGVPIEALAGEGSVKVPAAVLRCVNCHAPDGRGKREGGIYPSNIRWSELSKPYAITTGSGRERPPYNESLVIRAITMGIDSGGKRLDMAMPKYLLTREQADDLVAYLKAVENVLDPGIADQSIKIGVILPPEETFGGMHRALRETLQAAFQKVNDEGGLYGRRILCAFNTAPQFARSESFEKFLQQEQPFALVESFIAGYESEINSCLEQNGIPLIGAISLYSGVDAPINRYAFYLLSGIQEQSEALARFAASNQGLKAAHSIVVCNEEEGIQAAVDRITKQAERLGWERPQSVNVKELKDWSLLLQDGKIDAVFWLASSENLGELFAAAITSQVFPLVLAPSAFVGPEIYQTPNQFSGRLFLSFPILPTDQTKEGEKEYLELARAGKFSQGNLAERLAALSAAKLLIYALQKAGREVTREKIIETLEKLYQFDTAQTPPLTFSPNRRVGALGAHIVGIDLEKKQLLLPSTWIELESP